MINFDSLLEKIDLYFHNKQKSEINLIFLMVFSSIAFLLYTYLYPETEKALQKTKQQAKIIETQLIDEKSYLDSVSTAGDSTYLIKKTKTDIEQTKALLEKTTLTNTYVDSKLKELSYLLFNEENWANFLNSITQLAQTYSVHIKVIENKLHEPTLQKIEQILTLKIDFSGSFANTMKFMNALEESELVVDIYELNCSSTGAKNIEGQFHIAVWGMKY